MIEEIEEKYYKLTVIDAEGFLIAQGETNDREAWKQKVLKFKKRFPKAECSRSPAGNRVFISSQYSHHKNKAAEKTGDKKG